MIDSDFGLLRRLYFRRRLQEASLRSSILQRGGGFGYTIYSEYLNIAVRRAWGYSELMPTLPPLGTGLSPLLQWVVVPLVGFALMRHRARQPQP